MLDNLSPEDSALWLATSVAELWPVLLPQVGRRVPNSFDATAAFTRVHADDPAHAGLTARLLLTQARWRRVTGELVRALEGTELLADAELDRMALELFAGPRWEVPVTGVQLALMRGTAVDHDGRPLDVADDEVVALDRGIEPPLRRWAAQRALRRDLTPLKHLLAASRGPLPARHRALLFAGILDAIDRLSPQTTEQLLPVGLAWPNKTVRDVAARLHAARTARSTGADVDEFPNTLW